MPTLVALAARVAALESLVGERDARITALEKALEKAVTKIGEFFLIFVLSTKVLRLQHEGNRAQSLPAK